ncbi:helix-turn-helix domain-containing protein [Pseudonocardia kunmingensis]|uniref:AlpA family transcriptional regulator n=1 Tax=Pseudonocardia kunmingensis TaxID=630975 RepID=A0A543DAT6_9PSEU|nr:AlpA family transcriptional regulator [Pseudonocardia kunmingensis]
MPQTKPSNEILYTVPEVRDGILRVSHSTLYRIIRSGQLKPIKIGRTTRFRESEVKRYLDSLEAKPLSEASNQSH